MDINIKRVYVRMLESRQHKYTDYLMQYNYVLTAVNIINYRRLNRDWSSKISFKRFISEYP